ncbi:MAG: hypothetical protein HZB39_11890, partial [Planctomycetes bacterium]|nr:hypothetical protein [Planctomycetota bacterium]
RRASADAGNPDGLRPRPRWADDDNGVPSGADPVIGYFVEYESPRWRPIGVGCAGSAGLPVMTATTSPDLGATFTLAVTNLPTAGGAFVMAIGFSDAFWPGVGPLPFELNLLGAPTCFVFCDPVLTETRPNLGEAGAWSLLVPTSPSLAGAVFFQQAFVVDPPANSFGLTVTNGGRAVLQ